MSHVNAAAPSATIYSHQTPTSLSRSIYFRFRKLAAPLLSNALIYANQESCMQTPSQTSFAPHSLTQQFSIATFALCFVYLSPNKYKVTRHLLLNRNPPADSRQHSAELTMVWGFVTCGPNEALVVSGESENSVRTPDRTYRDEVIDFLFAPASSLSISRTANHTFIYVLHVWRQQCIRNDWGFIMILRRAVSL